MARGKKHAAEQIVSLRKLQLQAARRVAERRNLLLDPGDQGACGALARPLQHHQATPLAGLQVTGAAALGGKEHRRMGKWKAKYASHFPTPRWQLSKHRDSCATLTISLV
jgi:hypothetical protein